MYTVEAEIIQSGDISCVSSKTYIPESTTYSCGFREFRVENGYFRLNGKRLFLKTTHTGNHYPISWVVPQHPDLIRKDLLLAKACGFNMVRFVAGVALPEQLDFCDRLGLLVYEEANAGWHYAGSASRNTADHLDDCPELRCRYRASYNEMILRDRNHPSLVIWGLLNETYDSPIFHYAVDYLKELRTIDNSRLVLLGSGRFDGRLDIGSVSNPGSCEWEYQWGEENPGRPSAPTEWGYGVPAYVEKAGDIHVYPVQPQSKEIDQFIRTVGYDTKPVFLSEYGVASQTDAIGAVRMYEQLGARQDLAEVELYKMIADSVVADFGKYKLNDTYSFPEDMLIDSQRFNARQRLRGFDLIRSNPKICGYNFTGMLDHAITGEGIWDFWRVWKRDYCDVMTDGFSPLRWCIFVDSMHSYSGNKVRFEAVLANEDVLVPGNYPACFRIRGPKGIIWEKKINICLPEPQKGEDAPIAVKVLDEEVFIEGPTGTYEFAAAMLHGGKPAGGRKEFYVTDISQLPAPKDFVTVWGIEPYIVKWLEEKGIRCSEICFEEASQAETILVGNPLDPDITQWKSLALRIATGSTAVFLDVSALKRNDDNAGCIPLAVKGQVIKFYDCVYHKDCVAKNHPVFKGLQPHGVMDWDYYGEIIPHEMFDGQPAPDDTAAMAFAAGYLKTGGYGSGLLFGGYNLGKGRFYLNTLHILKNISRHPAADILLQNIIEYCKENNKCNTVSPETKAAEELVAALYPAPLAKDSEAGISDDEKLLQSFTGKKKGTAID